MSFRVASIQERPSGTPVFIAKGATAYGTASDEDDAQAGTSVTSSSKNIPSDMPRWDNVGTMTTAQMNFTPVDNVGKLAPSQTLYIFFAPGDYTAFQVRIFDGANGSIQIENLASASGSLWTSGVASNTISFNRVSPGVGSTAGLLCVQLTAADASTPPTPCAVVVVGSLATIQAMCSSNGDSTPMPLSPVKIPSPSYAPRPAYTPGLPPALPPKAGPVPGPIAARETVPVLNTAAICAIVIGGSAVLAIIIGVVVTWYKKQGSKTGVLS